MRRLALGCAIGAAALGTLMPAPARAAGFALKEQSTTAMGNAFAGATTGTDDVSFMFFNPAALGWLDRPQAQVEATLALPRIELENARGSTALGTPITGSDHDDDVAENAVIPAFYAATPLGRGLTAGLGINVPFGLETEYDKGWVGRYHAVQSRLETVNINPALAWRPYDWLSVGGGVQAQYADGRLTNAVDLGTIGAVAGIPGAQPGGDDGFAKLDGNDWSYGANAGVMVEPRPGTRLGLAWRSEIDHRIKGDVNFRDDSAGIAQGLRAQAELFADSGASVELHTPQSVSFGVRQEVTSELAVMAEAQWTDWSVFDQLTIQFDNPDQPSSVTEEEWHDAWFFAVGSTWKISPAWTVRGGLAYDQSPVRTRYRTPRIPDSDRYWLSLGAGYRPASWFGVDLGLTYIFLDDSEVRLSAEDAGNQTRGNLDADFASHIILLGLNARLRF